MPDNLAALIQDADQVGTGGLVFDLVGGIRVAGHVAAADAEAEWLPVAARHPEDGERDDERPPLFVNRAHIVIARWYSDTITEGS